MSAELGGCQGISKKPLAPLQGLFHRFLAQTCQCVYICMYSRDVQKLASWHSLLTLSVLIVTLETYT